MKDYLLSEIKNANLSELTDCVELTHIHFLIKDCNIERRNMIDLPCALPIKACNGYIMRWQLIKRSKLTGDLIIKYCDTEAEANAFLAQLKVEE